MPPPFTTDTLEDKGGLGDFMNILFVQVAFDALVHLEHVGSSGSVNTIPASPPALTNHLRLPSNGKGIIYEQIIKVEQITRSNRGKRLLDAKIQRKILRFRYGFDKYRPLPLIPYRLVKLASWLQEEI